MQQKIEFQSNNSPYFFPLQSRQMCLPISEVSIYFAKGSTNISFESAHLNGKLFESRSVRLNEVFLYFLGDHVKVGFENLYCFFNLAAKTLELVQHQFILKMKFSETEALVNFITSIERWVIFKDFSRFTVVRDLDKGCFGSVKLMQDTFKRGKFVTLKSIEIPKNGDKDAHRALFNEVHILRKMRHENVLKLYTVLEDEHFVSLVTEFINGGTLETFVAENRIDERLALDITHSLLKAVSEANKYNFVHRDIKPMNIMYKHSKKQMKKIWKLIDFGLSENYLDFSENSLMHDRTGTVCYMAPEILDGNINKGIYNEQVDVFSIGIVLFELSFKKNYGQQSLQNFIVLGISPSQYIL